MLEQINYFGMYYGKKIYFNNPERENKIYNFRFAEDNNELRLMSKDLHGMPNNTYCNIINCKLILRTFEDMTGEERKEMVNLLKEILTSLNNEKKDYPFKISKYVEWMIEKGFDIFNLIEKGWAVRESEIGK